MTMARDLAPTPDFFLATKSDSVDEAYPSTGGIRVGNAGDVVAVKLDGTAVTIQNVQAGEYLPIVAKRINNTNTTASNILFYPHK
jgi:hypothetical protein